MKYDFETVMERNEDCLAAEKIPFEGVQPEEGVSRINMWIADMSFPTAPSILKAIRERTDKAHFGYFSLSDSYYDSIISWQERRNGVFGLEKDDIGYENGVLGGALSALGVFCSKGDNVLLHSPTYIGFTNSLRNSGYNIVHSPLKKDALGIWRMDFEDMEEKIRSRRIHAAVFCSPHNPCGRVWTREEIFAFTELCRKYDVKIISDEIWSDMILFGNRHIPTQSVSEDARNRTVALYAPSKTFNLAGLVGSYHIIYDPAIRDRVRKESSLSHYNNINIISMYALIGAYSPEGYAWVDELLKVLGQNIDYACSFIEDRLPGVEVSKPEGTYMLFADCSQYCARTGKSLDDVLNAAWKVGVAIQDGRPFHGECHTRINLALPLSRVKEAFERLEAYVFVD